MALTKVLEGGIADDAVGNAKLDLTESYAFTGDITGVNTPAFKATRSSSAQTITQNTWTKVQYNGELLDTGGMYDPSTNYRFTPTVAGKYYIFTNVNSGNTNTHIYGALYFNGSALTSLTIDGSQGGGVYVGNVVTFNGSSDYIEAYTYQGTGTGAVEDAAQYSIFGGYRLIGV